MVYLVISLFIIICYCFYLHMKSKALRNEIDTLQSNSLIAEIHIIDELRNVLSEDKLDEVVDVIAKNLDEARKDSPMSMEGL